MRRTLWSGFYGAAALALAMLPSIAAAQIVTVIRGSEVSVVQGPGGFAEEARREVVPSSPRERSADRPLPAPVEPPRQVVLLVLSTRDPDTARRLATPWTRPGIKVHRISEPRGRSRIRVHRAGRPGG